MRFVPLAAIAVLTLVLSPAFAQRYELVPHEQKVDPDDWNTPKYVYERKLIPDAPEEKEKDPKKRKECERAKAALHAAIEAKEIFHISHEDVGKMDCQAAILKADVFADGFKTDFEIELEKADLEFKQRMAKWDADRERQRRESDARWSRWREEQRQRAGARPNTGNKQDTPGGRSTIPKVPEPEYDPTQPFKDVDQLQKGLDSGWPRPHVPQPQNDGLGQPREDFPAYVAPPTDLPRTPPAPIPLPDPIVVRTQERAEGFGDLMKSAPGGAPHADLNMSHQFDALDKWVAGMEARDAAAKQPQRAPAAPSVGGVGDAPFKQGLLDRLDQMNKAQSPNQHRNTQPSAYDTYKELSDKIPDDAKPDSVKIAEKNAESASPIGKAGAGLVYKVGDKINELLDAPNTDKKTTDGTR